MEVRSHIHFSFCNAIKLKMYKQFRGNGPFTTKRIGRLEDVAVVVVVLTIRSHKGFGNRLVDVRHAHRK